MYSDIPEGFEPVDQPPTDGGRPALATTFGYRDPEDNGVGAWGDRTNNPDIMGASLPTSVLRDHFGDADAAHGAMVEVTNPATQKSVIVPIVDKGPADWVIHRQGDTIDLTHAANRAIGGTGKSSVQFRILGHPDENGLPPGYQPADDNKQAQHAPGAFSDLPPGFVPVASHATADDLIRATPREADQLGLPAWRDNADGMVVARAKPVERQRVEYQLPPKVRGPFEAFGSEFMGATAKGAINSVAGVARALSKAEENPAEATIRFDSQIDDQQAAIDGLKAAIAKRGFSSAEDDAALARMGQELKNLQITKDLTLKTDQFTPEAQAGVEARREAAKADADALAKNASDSAAYWGADPRDKSTAAQVGRGIGNVTAMAPTMVVPGVGLPLAALQGASMAYEDTYTATADQMHKAGVSDPQTIEDAAHQAASTAAAHTLPALSVYMVGGKLTSDAVGALFKASTPLVKGLAGGTAAAGANMVSSGIIRAASGEDWRPDVESATQDIAFGGIHGLGTGRQAAAEAAQRGQPDRPNEMRDPINIGPRDAEPASGEPQRPATAPEEARNAETPAAPERNEWTTATDEDGFVGRPDEEFEREKAQESAPEETGNVENNLPPVPKGHVRFFHGGIPGEGGRDVSPYYEYAKGYADKTKGGVVQYIDVPENDTNLSRDTDAVSGTGMEAPYNWFHASAELMEKAKTVPNLPAEAKDIEASLREEDRPPIEEAITADQPDTQSLAASIKRKMAAKKQGGFIDADVLSDIHDYGRAIYRKGMDYLDWSMRMVKDLGNGIKGILRQVWKTINGGRLPHASETGAVGSRPNATAAVLAKKRRGIAAELAGAVKDKAREVKSFVHDLPEFGDFKRSLLTWNAKNQKSSNEIERIHGEIAKQIPDPIRREAITNWIQAEGNVPTLISRAEASKSAKVRKGYEAAARLTPEEIKVANSIRDTFDILHNRAERAGIEIPYRNNYVPEVWKDDPELPPGTSSRRLSENFKFAKERVFKDYFEGEQAGFQPETKDIANLLALYMNDMNNAINARQFVAELSKAKAADGRPILALRGGGKRVETERGKSHLVFPDRPEEEARDYKVIDQPALHDWRVVGKSEDGTKIMVMGDLSVHPDVAKHLKNVLGQSALREWWSTKTDNPFLNAVKSAAKFIFDDAQSFAKGTMLSFSPFHQVQEGVHAIGHRINPIGLTKDGKLHDLLKKALPQALLNPLANMPKIDMRDPAQLDAARHGLMLAHDKTSQALFMEGVGENSRNLVTLAAKKFGGRAGRAFADLFDGYQHWLFGQYIPGLKFKTYVHILERNLARYAKELKAGDATVEQVKNLSARQSNAAYGHLNYVEMGHSPTIRHAMQVALLAPDFLEARARFVGQALKAPFSKTGAEQLQALGFLAITQFIAARIANKLSTDDYGWDHPFELRVGNKWYGFRSVPEDLYKLAHDRQGFIGGRVSPIFGKFIQEGIFHTNYRNERTSELDAIKDILTGMIPLPVQALTRDLTAQNKANPVSPFEQILGATGIHVSRYSPLTEIYKKAHDWTDKNRPNESSKAVYPVSKYTQLRYALEDGDRDAARAEVRKLQKSGITLAAISSGFAQSVNRPFTGSEKTDALFFRDLDAAGRMAYRAAEKRRDLMVARYERFIGPIGSK